MDDKENIKRFQEATGLVVDGTADKNTKAKLKELGFKNIDDWIAMTSMTQYSPYQNNNNTEKLKQLEKDIIARRLAGLPSNTSTWHDKEQTDNDVLNIDGLYFKPKGSYLTQPSVQPAYRNNDDWEYKNALMHRLFGNETPMQQYLTQKQAERQSRDSAIYNQYISMQNKVEQQAEKEKEARLQAEKDKIEKQQAEKEKAAENAKKQALINEMIDNPESNMTEINKAIIDSGLDKVIFADKLVDREKQTEQYRNIDKKIRNNIKKEDVEQIKTQIRNSSMPISFREKLLKLLSETKTIEEKKREANVNASIATGASKQTTQQQTKDEAKRAISNDTPKSKLSDAVKAYLKDAGYVWFGSQKKWIKR